MPSGVAQAIQNVMERGMFDRCGFDGFEITELRNVISIFITKQLETNKVAKVSKQCRD